MTKRRRFNCADGGFAHHWKLDDPDGPTTSGVCTRCGRTPKPYSNSTDGGGWNMRSEQAKANVFASTAHLRTTLAEERME
jgi:hypothetical protein